MCTDGEVSGRAGNPITLHGIATTVRPWWILAGEAFRAAGCEMSALVRSFRRGFVLPDRCKPRS